MRWLARCRGGGSRLPTGESSWLGAWWRRGRGRGCAACASLLECRDPVAQRSNLLGGCLCLVRHGGWWQGMRRNTGQAYVPTDMSSHGQYWRPGFNHSPRNVQCPRVCTLIKITVQRPKVATPRRLHRKPQGQEVVATREVDVFRIQKGPAPSVSPFNREWDWRLAYRLDHLDRELSWTKIRVRHRQSAGHQPVRPPT